MLSTDFDHILSRIEDGMVDQQRPPQQIAACELCCRLFQVMRPSSRAEICCQARHFSQLFRLSFALLNYATGNVHRFPQPQAIVYARAQFPGLGCPRNEMQRPAHTSRKQRKYNHQMTLISDIFIGVASTSLPTASMLPEKRS